MNPYAGNLPTAAEIALDHARDEPPRPLPVDLADFAHGIGPCSGCGAQGIDPCHPLCDVGRPF